MFIKKFVKKIPNAIKEPIKTKISLKNQEIIKETIHYTDDFISNKVEEITSYLSKSIESLPSKSTVSSHDVAYSSKSEDQQRQKDLAEYLECFEKYKDKILPEMTAYYINIKAKELDLSFEHIDELYAQHGKCQVFPIIQTNDILKEVSLPKSFVKAHEAVKIWAKTYGIESNSDSMIFYMKEILMKLSKANSEKIIDDFLKSK